MGRERAFDLQAPSTALEVDGKTADIYFAAVSTIKDVLYFVQNTVLVVNNVTLHQSITLNCLFIVLIIFDIYIYICGNFQLYLFNLSRVNGDI